MVLPACLLETCRGVKPSGCPHAAPALEPLVTVLALAKRCLETHARHMRPGLRFADIVFPGGQPGLPAWVLS